jgi:hypothetical protein
MLRVGRPDVKLALSEPDTAPLVASGLEQQRDENHNSTEVTIFFLHLINFINSAFLDSSGLFWTASDSGLDPRL